MTTINMGSAPDFAIVDFGHISFSSPSLPSVNEKAVGYSHSIVAGGLPEMS